MLPAFAGMIAKRLGRGSTHRRSGVMPGPIGPPRERAPTSRVVVEVLRRVPAIAGHVDAAAEGEASSMTTIFWWCAAPGG